MNWQGKNRPLGSDGFPLADPPSPTSMFAPRRRRPPKAQGENSSGGSSQTSAKVLPVVPKSVPKIDLTLGAPSSRSSAAVPGTVKLSDILIDPRAIPDSDLDDDECNPEDLALSSDDDLDFVPPDFVPPDVAGLSSALDNNEDIRRALGDAITQIPDDVVSTDEDSASKIVQKPRKKKERRLGDLGIPIDSSSDESDEDEPNAASTGGPSQPLNKTQLAPKDFIEMAAQSKDGAKGKDAKNFKKEYVWSDSEEEGLLPRKKRFKAPPSKRQIALAKHREKALGPEPNISEGRDPKPWDYGLRNASFHKTLREGGSTIRAMIPDYTMTMTVYGIVEYGKVKERLKGAFDFTNRSGKDYDQRQHHSGLAPEPWPDVGDYDTIIHIPLVLTGIEPHVLVFSKMELEFRYVITHVVPQEFNMGASFDVLESPELDKEDDGSGLPRREGPVRIEDRISSSEITHRRILGFVKAFIEGRQDEVDPRVHGWRQIGDKARKSVVFRNFTDVKEITPRPDFPGQEVPRVSKKQHLKKLNPTFELKGILKPPGLDPAYESEELSDEDEGGEEDERPGSGAQAGHNIAEDDIQSTEDFNVELPPSTSNHPFASSSTEAQLSLENIPMDINTMSPGSSKSMDPMTKRKSPERDEAVEYDQAYDGDGESAGPVVKRRRESTHFPVLAKGKKDDGTEDESEEEKEQRGHESTADDEALARPLQAEEYDNSEISQ